ncbi:hypothetical protein K8S17_00045 [bacterium]|nr:hypothetical protein [bacterium]
MSSCLCAITLTLGMTACSDDIVCPETAADITPAITASIVETRLAGGDMTLVTVRCVSDPLPATFVVSVSGRDISDVDVTSPLGLIATLEDSNIVWQHGQICSLRVTTDGGMIASSAELVPGAFAIETPPDISLGDTLAFAWTTSIDADYYTVRCVIRNARDDSLVLERSVTDTTVAFAPEDVTMAGSISGRVTAVAGPFPDGGTDGNILGVGWGFFTVSYYDTLNLFEFEITAASETR